MDLNISAKKIKSILERFYLTAAKCEVTTDSALKLANFLIIYLKDQPQSLSISKLLETLPSYIPYYPLRFLIPLVRYLSYGHIQDKGKILEILERYYYSNDKMLDICISVLIMSSFQAVSESSDLSITVVNIIDKISDRTRVYECVWKIVLNSSKPRLPALNYLQYRLVTDNKTRALHALLVCLEDHSLQVKKTSLELIRRVFNFNNQDVDKKYKVTILVHALKLIANNDRTMFICIFEWINAKQEIVSEHALAIISEALLETLKIVQIEEAVQIITNFICNFPYGQAVLCNIIIPMAIFHCSSKNTFVSSSITSLISNNSQLFWQQLKENYAKSFRTRDSQEALYQILLYGLINFKCDYHTIDYIILSLIENIDSDIEKHLNWLIEIFNFIETTSITEANLLEVYNKVPEIYLKELARLLIRCYKLGVNCSILIHDLYQKYSDFPEKKIDLVNILLENDKKLIKKIDVEDVIRYSMDTGIPNTLLKLIEIIPNKVNSCLEYFLEFDFELGLEYLTYVQRYKLSLTQSLLIKAIEFISESDAYTKILGYKWLNFAISSGTDLFSPLVSCFESKSMTPSMHVIECSRILITIKEMVKFGGEVLLNTYFLDNKNSMLSRIQGFILNPIHSSRNLRMFSCELACEIVNYTSSDASFILVDAAVSILTQTAQIEDNMMLLILLQLLENYLKVLKVEAEKEIQNKGLINILYPLTKIIVYKDKTVRNSWLNFISQLLTFMMHYLDENISVNYVNSLLKNYFNIYQSSKDPKILESIEILTKEALSTSYPISKTIQKLVYFSLQKYLDMAISTPNADMIYKGNQIIFVLFKSNKYKFVKNFIFIWTEHCPYDQSYWNTLDRYIDLLVAINPSLFDFIAQIYLYINKKFQKISEEKEKILSLASMVCKIQEKLECHEKSELLKIFIDIYKYFLSIPIPEMSVFILSSLSTLKSTIKLEKLEISEKLYLKKVIKEILSASIVHIQYFVPASSIPYPYVDYKPNILISEIYKAALKHTTHNIIDIGMPESSRPKLIADFSKNLYYSFKTFDFLITEIPDLILYTLKIEPVLVSAILNSHILYLVKQPFFLEFLKGKVKILCIWKKILKIISMNFHEDQNKVLKDLLEYIKPSQFISILTRQGCDEYSMLILSFTILSSKGIEDQGILEDISDLLFNSFKDPSLFSSFCLVFKSLYTKVPPSMFSEVLSRILPALFPELMRIVRTKSEKTNLLACLKLLEFFTVTGNQTFAMYEGALISQLLLCANTFSSIELRTVSSVKTEIEAEASEKILYYNDYNENNIENAIQHYLLYSLQSKDWNVQGSVKEIKNQIIIDLVN
jgi:Dopey, N-terminal